MRPFLAAIICLAIDAKSWAAVSWNVTVNDMIGSYSSLESTIISHTQLAGAAWSNRIVTAPNASIEVAVRIWNVPSNRGGGGSATHFFVGTHNGIGVFEQGAARELKTGRDPNGATPDIYIELDPDYIDTEMWWDPDPQTRTAPVPNNRIDDMSVLLHEIGHAIAMNGWRDWTTALLPPGSGQSPFDVRVTTIGGNHYFTGAAAMSIYGGMVPLTAGNLFHFGNHAPGPGSELEPDLMNGIVFHWGRRYDISALDLAMLQDVGIPIPEPGTYMILSSLGFVFSIRRVTKTH